MPGDAGSTPASDSNASVAEWQTSKILGRDKLYASSPLVLGSNPSREHQAVRFAEFRR